VLSRTMRERHQALMDITKRIVAAWVRTSPDGPERRRLVDEFLDLSTLNHGLNEIVRAVPVAEWAEKTLTATDAERYRADAEGWKAEAERWRRVSEAKQMDVDRLELEMRAEIDRADRATQTDGQRTGDAGYWMNECLNAERELTKAREAVRLLSTTAQELDAVLNPQFQN